KRVIMSVYKPTYTEAGKTKHSSVWWYHFTFAGRRIQESSKSTRKTIAMEAEKKRRLELERAYAGMPSGAAAERIASVGEKVKTYLEQYPCSHRQKSVTFSTQRLA